MTKTQKISKFLSPYSVFGKQDDLVCTKMSHNLISTDLIIILTKDYKKEIIKLNKATNRHFQFLIIHASNFNHLTSNTYNIHLFKTLLKYFLKP